MAPLLCAEVRGAQARGGPCSQTVSRKAAAPDLLCPQRVRPLARACVPESADAVLTLVRNPRDVKLPCRQRSLSGHQPHPGVSE